MSQNYGGWIVRFGVYEANLRSGELRKQGARIKLQEQPFQVLAMLLEKPGEIVTREEMRQRLWPQDTFVDFDHSLNKAINKVRDALCDSAENPRFVETLARRGYRFIAPVEWNHVAQSPQILTETTTPLPSEESTLPAPSTFSLHEGTAQLPIHPEVYTGPEAVNGGNRIDKAAARTTTRHLLTGWNSKRWIAVVALLVVLIIPLYLYLSRQKSEAVREPLRIVPFTTLPGMETNPKFSPDGKFVAFEWNGLARDNWDIYVKQVGQEGQLRLTYDPAKDSSPAWSPEGGEIAFVRESGDVTSIYTVPSLGGSERKLYELRTPSGASALSWSPDGCWLAFSEKSSVESPYRIFLLSLDTRQKFPLTSPPPGPYSGDINSEFSPDGKRVAFSRVKGYGACDLWVQSVSSGEATQLTHENYFSISRPAWTADGREIIFAAFTGNTIFLRIPSRGGVPQAIAGIGENASRPTIWRNRMVFTQYAAFVDKIWRMRGPNFKGETLTAAPILVSTRPDWNPDYSPDGKKLALNSTRSGFSEIWTCDSDGANPVPLTHLRKGCGTARWSPDGKRIAFDCWREDDIKIYIIDADGGMPKRLTNNEKGVDQSPSWSRDGRWIYFSSNRSGNFQVWKIPSEGGKALQVTKGGGFYARESFDDKMLFYIKPGRKDFLVGPIWKVPREGGEETLVLDRKFGASALRPDGIYFSNDNGKKYTIELLNFQTGKITLIYQEATPNVRSFLAISPDGEWFLYNDEPPRESDLMMVENFR